MEIGKLIQEIGLPLTIVIVLIYAVWYLFDILQKKYQDHEVWLCEKLEDITKTNQELSETNKSLSEAINRSLLEINSKLEHSYMMLEDIKSDIKIKIERS